MSLAGSAVNAQAPGSGTPGPGQSLRQGVAWLAFGKLGNRLFEFAFGVALARLLVPADFGMIATVQIFTGFVGMFVAGGMGQSLIRAREASPEDFTAVFTLQMALGAAVYAAFYVAAPLLARFFGDPLYEPLVRISSLSFLLRPLVTARTAWLNRAMDFRSRTLADVSTALVAGAVSVALAAAGMGVWSLTLAGLAGALFHYVWLGRLTPLRLRLNFDTAAMRRHAGFGARIVGADLVDQLRAQARTLLLSKLAGPAFLGLFNKAESLSRIPNQLLMSPTMEPLFRAMSRTQDEPATLEHLYLRAVTLLMAYTAPMYALLWWTAEPFVAVVYGPKWADAGEPMAILALAGPALNVALPSSVLLAVCNRLGQEMKATALNIPVLAGLCWAGLGWGLAGVAWAVVAATVLHAAQLYAIVWRTLPTRPQRLLAAVAPGLALAALQFAFAGLVHAAATRWLGTGPVALLLVVGGSGLAFAAACFMLLPLQATRSEAARWRALGARAAAGAAAAWHRAVARRNRAAAPPPGPGRRARWRKPLAVALVALPAVAVAAAVYSARADLEPLLERMRAGQGSRFAAMRLPERVIPQIYDMGVADVDGDGRPDLYTANHNYRQHLWRNTGGGRFAEVADDWGLQPSGALPGSEQSRTPPSLDRPGLYVYWVGDLLHLQFHEIETLGPVRVQLTLHHLATVVAREGVALEENVSRLGELPRTQLTVSAQGSGRLVLYPLVRGAPLRLRVDAPWAREHTRLGRRALVPAPGAGLAAADAAQALAGCAQCLVFEMALQDRHGMAWADFNADGVPDVFVNRGAIGGTLRSFPQEVRERVSDELLLSAPPGRHTDHAREAGLRKKDCSGRHTRLVDFDGDGRLDIFVNCLDRGHVAGRYPKQLWRQTRPGHFEDVAAEVGLDLPLQELVDMVWFDADGDGRPDLLTHEDTGYFLHTGRAGRFERRLVHVGPFHRASEPGLRGNTHDYWQFDGKLSVADFDGDGRLDVFVASKRGNVLLVNRGGGRMEAADLAALGLPLRSVAAVWTDHDNDGRPDLHVVPEGLYHQQADGRFVRTGLLALSAQRYQAALVNWFDSDGDGALDVVIALQKNASLWRWWERWRLQADPKGRDDRFDWQLQGWHNHAGAGHWLELDLTGPAGNRPAVGAHVTVLGAGAPRVAQVGSHEGASLSQGHYRLHFGLGTHAGPLTLRIAWPDGVRQTVEAVATGRVATVRHPAAEPPAPPAPPRAAPADAPASIPPTPAPRT